jgi:TolB-like protein/Tfp pilus assembly protein PilF
MNISKAFKNNYLYILLVLILALITFLAGEYFTSGGLLEPGSAVTGSPRTRDQVYYGPPHSLAVLALRASEVSGSQDQQHWAEGFSAGLARRLARVEQVHLIAPTSSFFFADQQLSKKVMGERLRAAHLLDGELAIQQDQLRLALSLTRSRDEAVVWTGAFERPLGSFAELQVEVLVAVLETMKIDPPPEIPRARPVTIPALEAFLQGSRSLRSGTPDGLQQAIDHFRVATELQSGYGQALSGLAQGQFALSRYLPGNKQIQQAARQNLERALAAQPRPPEALALQSYIRRSLDWDWREAHRVAEEGLEMMPGDTRLMNQASLALFSLGRFEEAMPLLRESVARDPLNLLIRVRLGLVHEFTGDFDEALQVYRQVTALNPEFPGVYAYRARVKLLQEKPDSALEESERETAGFWQRYARILALDALGLQQESEPLLQSMIAEDGDLAAFQLAEIFSFRGDIQAAFEWLEKAFEQRDSGMEELIGNHFLQPLHGDPAWPVLLEQMGHTLD